MRWKRRSLWLLGSGLVLLVISLSILIWLCSMEAGAHICSNPNATSLEDRSQGYEEDGSNDGFVEVDWDYWKEINPDIIAWVNVVDTQVNYPIMRAPAHDPSYYLHHDIYRNYSIYGVPYLDTDYTDAHADAFNAIIYGHHMDNGSMFSDFASYADEDYARDHATICLQTPAGKQRLIVSFVSIIDGDTTPKGIQFSDEEAFHAWFQEQRANAQVVIDNENGQVDESASTNSGSGSSSESDLCANPDRALTTESPMDTDTDGPDQIVTFCTCSYHTFANERTLVVCVPNDN